VRRPGRVGKNPPQQARVRAASPAPAIVGGLMTSRLVTVPFVLVTVTVFLGALSPNFFVLAPRYLAERHHDPDAIGLVMSCFMIGSLSTMPTVGRIIQRGRRALVLTAGCVVGAAGCAAFSFAEDIPGFVCARLVQGCGFAAVLVSGSAYVAEIAPPGRLAQALGFAGVLTLASQAVGPALGELIVHASGWAWLFRAAAVAGVIGAAVGSFLPPIPDHERAPAPPRDDGLSAWPAIVAMGLAGFGFGAVVGFLSAYADDAGVGAVSPFFAPYVAAAVGTRVLLGHLSDRHGRRATAVPALIIHSAALVALAGIGARWHLIAIGAGYGLAHGVYYPALQAQIVDRADPDARSRAIAASTLAFGLGVFTAQLGLGFVAKAFGYPVIYLVAAVAGIAAAIAVWRDRE